MSSPPVTHDASTTRNSTADESNASQRLLERHAPALAKPIRTTSFWTAIVLPFLYLPLLAVGLSSTAETLTFLGLLGVNLLALYVGHSHRR